MIENRINKINSVLMAVIGAGAVGVSLMQAYDDYRFEVVSGHRLAAAAAQTGVTEQCLRAVRSAATAAAANSTNFYNSLSVDPFINQTCSDVDVINRRIFATASWQDTQERNDRSAHRNGWPLLAITTLTGAGLIAKGVNDFHGKHGI